MASFSAPEPWIPPARGGLGLRVTDTAFVLEKFGVVLPRLEKEVQPRQDHVLAMGSGLAGQGGPRLPSVSMIAFARSVVDSDEEVCEPPGGGVESWAACMAAAATGQAEGGDHLLYDGEPLGLEPGDGAWVPVRREHEGPGVASCAGPRLEVVLQALGSETDVAPGLWTSGAKEGMVLSLIHI